MSSGLSNIHIDGEKLLVLEDVLGMERARQMAEDQKIKAFGLLSSLLSRPKSEDIEIVYEEKRYDAYWRVIGASRFEYKRRKVYTVPVDAIVQEIETLGTTMTPSPQSKTFDLEAVERCIEECHSEEIVDAQTGAAGEYSRYANLPSRQITSTDELSADGSLVAALEAKPAFLIRKVVNALIKPIQADTILDEQIGIHELSLTFIPVYTFEFLWKSKDKRVTVSYCGATGEVRPKANKITERLRKTFSNAELFEFGKEVANFVPGGGLAMMVGKKAIELTKKD